MFISDQELKDVVFFSMDQSMRRLRNYSNQAFHEAGFDLTVDQWLVLKRVYDAQEQVSQTEIAEMLSKDGASLTRILDILVKKELLFRKMNETDRRKFDLLMTPKGTEYIQRLIPLVISIREKALNNVSDAEIIVLRTILEKIKTNLR
ncbi:MarR family winged helix-turn-helix transcriptional regulator [Haliscomenobacter sp.]|uniref:MarR family winged helix-turn-helix transcriptional regulator n=1 Tax=Haliscomenobacter sp. TaxID=2717303 RepID=UPI003592EC6F